MRIIQEQLAGGSGAAGETRLDCCVRPRAGSDAVKFKMTDLPQATPKRWGARRKAEVVDVVRGGLLSLGEALERYALSTEEYLIWQHAIDRFGLPGLRVNRMQQNRRGRSRSTDH
jgi:uncharacterized protein DUF1153